MLWCGEYFVNYERPFHETLCFSWVEYIKFKFKFIFGHTFFSAVWVVGQVCLRSQLYLRISMLYSPYIPYVSVKGGRKTAAATAAEAAAALH